jgi:outer membrane protein, heavy metal efflux system
MILRSFALVVVIIFGIQSSEAQVPDGQEAPPLESLLREALENNPGIESARFREQATEQRIDQMRSWMPPNLKYQFNRQPLGVMGQVDFMSMHTYSLSQMIPFPGKISARVDMERANYEMASFDRSDDEVQLAAKVKETYYELWMMEKKLEVNRDLQKLLENFVASAERMYEVDMAGLEAVLSAQTNVSKLRTEERTLKNDYNKMLAMLNQLLDREPDTALGTIITLPAEDIPYDAAELEQRMLGHRPDIQAMRSGIDMNQAEIRFARREYYPDIMVDVMYMQMPGGMQDQVGTMVSLQIPLAPWSSNMVTKRVSEAQSERRSREKSLENMTTMARSELRQAFLDIETHLDVLRLYREEVIPNAEQTAESALGAFQAGKTEYLMVLDSFRMLEMFRMEYYMAQAEFHKAIAELERQAGIVM